MCTSFIIRRVKGLKFVLKKEFIKCFFFHIVTSKNKELVKIKKVLKTISTIKGY